MKNNSSQPIGIIGGGLAGLASACTLAARGYEVILFEANPWLGGKAAELNEQGFRFDMGPTILTLPSVLRRIFAESDRRLSDYLELVKLEPQWRSFFEDGSTLDLVSDDTAMTHHLDRFAPGGKVSAGYRKFLALAKRLNDISQQFYFYKPIGGLRDMFNARNAFNPAMLSDVLANSPAVLCGIAHMQTDEGVWYPVGGTRAVPVALAKLARELGVEFRPNTQIKRITIESGRVTGVITDNGENIALSAVVSNMDAVRTHRELIGGEVGRRFDGRREYEPACSGVVLYLGLKERYEHIAHHNFVFSRDHEEEFDAIYNQGNPRLIRPPIFARLRRPSQRWPRTAVKRFMCWFTRLICDRTTIGNKCCQLTAARSLRSSSARRAWKTSRIASCSSACSRLRTFTTVTVC